MKVLSLGGAGAVCQHSTRDLVTYSDFDEIVIGEYNVTAAEKLAAEIGDPRSIDVLLSAINEQEEPEVSAAATSGIVRIGGAAVPALIRQLQVRNPEYPADQERALAARVLGRIGDRRSLGVLVAALDDPSYMVRNEARMALELFAPQP